MVPIRVRPASDGDTSEYLFGGTSTSQFTYYEPTYHTHPDKDRSCRHTGQREREDIVDEIKLCIGNFQHGSFFFSSQISRVSVNYARL
eukprot:scaffold1992_cov187-Amphora_coffeaeformis.AAC.5